MLYNIQYYIDSNPNYTVKYQQCNEIIFNIWQQVPNKLEISTLIEQYIDKKDEIYVPYYIFFKYENDREKNLINTIFKDKIVDINSFNIITLRYGDISNIIVICIKN